MRDYEVNWFGEQFMAIATTTNIAAMKRAAYTVERAAKESMKGGSKKVTLSGTGGKQGLVHFPSKPGFPPNVVTGVLKSSISTVVSIVAGAIEGWVGSDLNKMKSGMAAHGISATTGGVEYGYFLEVGTRFMQKRPWLRPALLRSRRAIMDIFKRANKT